MSRRFLSLVLALALALLGWPPPAACQTPVTDPDVLKGIRQVDEGDYDAAIVTLDGAVRRLAADKPRPADLPQAYLYLGIAYVGKGHDAAAKAKFREALKQLKDLSLSADKFPPKVINVFEAARDEVSRDAATAAAAAPAPTPAPQPKAAPAPEKKGGGGKALIVVGAVAAAGAGVALAAGGGSKSSGGSGTPGSGGLITTTFPSEVVVFGGGRDFVVDVTGSGKLTANVVWQLDGVLLGMYIVNLANPQQVLTNGSQIATKEVALQLDVTPGSYRISVTNSTGFGPREDTTFTLTVTHP